MALELANEIERDINRAAFWWCCNRDGYCIVCDRRKHIPAPEYDFEYWYRDIPTGDLLADSELLTEYNQAKASYENRTFAPRPPAWARLERKHEK